MVIFGCNQVSYIDAIGALIKSTGELKVSQTEGKSPVVDLIPIGSLFWHTAVHGSDRSDT